MPEIDPETAKKELIQMETTLIAALSTLYAQDKNGNNENPLLIVSIFSITWQSINRLTDIASKEAETSIGQIVLDCLQQISDQLKKYHYIRAESLEEYIQRPEAINHQAKNSDFVRQLHLEQCQTHFTLGAILEVCATRYMTEEEKNGGIRKPH